MTETNNESTVPHVYHALGEILKTLSVEKKGTLPSNMSGKSYAKAEDVSNEVKKLFVANGLIILPQERVVRHENIVTADRAVKVTIVIEGTYTIVSTQDESVADISGVGDGLASGTAVASNIASTNALKNALMRTFLITEQSVEDEAKNGSTETKPETQRKLDSAKKAPASKPTGQKQSTIKAQIQSDFVNNPDSPVDLAHVQRVQKEIQAAQPGLSGDALFGAILERLQSGEVA